MKKLYALETREISLVPKGANKKKFLVFKSHKETTMPKSSAASKAVAKDAGDLPPKKDSAALKAAEYDPNKPMDHEDGAAYNAPLSDRAQAALKAMSRIAAPHKGELKPEHIEQAMKDAGMGDGGAEDVSMQFAIPEGVSDEHHMAAMEKAKKKAMKAYNKTLHKLGTRKYPDEQPAVKAAGGPKKDEKDDEEDCVDKSGVAKTETNHEEESVSNTKIHKMDLSVFSDAQKHQLEGVFKAFDERTKELVQKNDALNTELKKRDEAEKQREYVAKAESLASLGLPQDEIVETLKDAAKLGEASYARVVKQYETLNSQAKAGGLFKELGTRGGNGAIDAEAQLDRLVDSIVQKSDGKRTKEELYAEALDSKEGQALYAQFKHGRKGGA